MTNPQLSIIIPTHNRPHFLPNAVHSALNQTLQDIEVIVVDDASTETAQLPTDSRLRVIRLEQSRGGAGARNVGTEAARARWITYLDDDDTLHPTMAEVSLAALRHTTVTSPVGVLSGLEKVNEQGKVVCTRIPPDLSSKGRDFFLEDPVPGRSYNTKQTLVVERSTVLAIGGWDESFRSRVHSDFFLRLNPACHLIGVPDITYRHLLHSGVHVSGNPVLRQESFHRLIQKHQATFAAHPRQFARFVYRHSEISWQQRRYMAASRAAGWAMTIAPGGTSRRLLKAGRTWIARRWPVQLKMPIPQRFTP